MPQYHYRAIDREGKRVSDKAFTSSTQVLIAELKKKGQTPIRIQEIRSQRKRIKLTLKDARDLSSFLFLLLDSGHTISDALMLISQGMGNPRIASACESWKREIDHGASFRDALSNPEVFVPAGFRSLAGIGESAGALNAVLKHLDEYFDRLTTLKNRLSMALIYPAIVLIVAIAAAIFIGFFILPNLNELVQTLEPNSSDVVGSVSLSWLIPLSFLLFIVAFILLILSKADNRIGMWKSRLLISIPGIGSFIKDWVLLGWSFSLEVLLSGGIPMSAALKEAAKASENRYLHSILQGLSDKLDKGGSLSSILRDTSEIPSIVPTWVSIGEKTGSDDEVFHPLRRYFEDRVGRSIDLATQLVEPIFIVILGIGIAVFVIRYLLPLFRMMGEIV